jgi:hypothetical protein
LRNGPLNDIISGTRLITEQVEVRLDYDIESMAYAKCLQMLKRRDKVIFQKRNIEVKDKAGASSVFYVSSVVLLVNVDQY